MVFGKCGDHTSRQNKQNQIPRGRSKDKRNCRQAKTRETKKRKDFQQHWKLNPQTELKIRINIRSVTIEQKTKYLMKKVSLSLKDARERRKQSMICFYCQKNILIYSSLFL